MHHIEIRFDRPDARYPLGEEVTGRVVVKAEHDFNFAFVRITYGWRTHGRGDRDRGSEITRVLVSDDQIFMRKGERREFPFRFAPMGPATYHGHKLNVDWYVTAYADSPSAGTSLRCEQDFLLLAVPPPDGTIPGNDNIPVSDLPRWSPELQGLQELEGEEFTMKSAGSSSAEGVLSALLVLCIIAAGVSFVWALWFSGGLRLWVTLAAAVMIGLLMVTINTTAYQQKLEVTECYVEPQVVFAGGKVICRLEFQVQRDVFLHNIAAGLSGLEVVTIGFGTASTREEHEFIKKGFVKTFDEQLSPGRTISFECALPVPADAPPSFESNNNQIVWSIKLDANLRGWPGLHRNFSLTVLSAAPGQ